MAQILTVPKGEKKKLVRTCLTEIGLDASFSQAKKWFMKNHKLTLADATFYHVRRDMQRDAVILFGKPKPDNSVSVGKTGSTVIEFVKAAQNLIDKIGKDETIALINLLAKGN